MPEVEEGSEEIGCGHSFKKFEYEKKNGIGKLCVNGEIFNFLIFKCERFLHV